METFAFSRPDFRIRKIDIGSGKTPVAAQHGVNGIPFLVLFSGGEEVARGSNAVIKKLNSL